MRCRKSQDLEQLGSQGRENGTRVVLIVARFVRDVACCRAYSTTSIGREFKVATHDEEAYPAVTVFKKVFHYST